MKNWLLVCCLLGSLSLQAATIEQQIKVPASTSFAYELLDLGDIPGSNVHFRQINDAKVAVGIFKLSGPWKPLVWSPTEGLHHLGYYLGWDITGVIWGVNQASMVAGYLEETEGRVPFTWS